MSVSVLHSLPSIIFSVSFLSAHLWICCPRYLCSGRTSSVSGADCSRCTVHVSSQTQFFWLSSGWLSAYPQRGTFLLPKPLPLRRLDINTPADKKTPWDPLKQRGRISDSDSNIYQPLCGYTHTCTYAYTYPRLTHHNIHIYTRTHIHAQLKVSLYVVSYLFWAL